MIVPCFAPPVLAYLPAPDVVYVPEETPFERRVREVAALKKVAPK